MRRIRSDSGPAAVQAAKAGSLRIQPPACVLLQDSDLPFWDAVVRARARDEWSDADLIVAAKLSRALADEERIATEVRAEGDVVENGRGTVVVNAKHALVEQLARRIMAFRRDLQVTGRATNGETREVAKRRAGARVVEEIGDDLLAKPLGAMQ